MHTENSIFSPYNQVGVCGEGGGGWRIELTRLYWTILLNHKTLKVKIKIILRIYMSISLIVDIYIIFVLLIIEHTYSLTLTNDSLLNQANWRHRWRLGTNETKRVCVCISFLSFFLFFFFFFFCVLRSAFQLESGLSVGPVHCSRDPQTSLFSSFSLKMGPTTLFTYLKIILLQYFKF